MVLDFALFDSILPKAERSARGRMHYDLRTQAFEDALTGPNAADGGLVVLASGDVPSGWRDTSQRMLNVLTPGTVIPVHRHNETSETVICLRGAVEEVFFSSDGVETESYVLRYGSECCAIQVPRGVYHTCRCLEPGSVIFEAKDRAYDSMRTEDMLEAKSEK